MFDSTQSHRKTYFGINGQAYLMKIILSVPDEGYSERTWWRLFWVYMMKVILSVHDEGYFERTWWRLLLHDIGTVCVNKNISYKPGSLTCRESYLQCPFFSFYNLIPPAPKGTRLYNHIENVRGVRIKIVTKSWIILQIFVNEGIRFVQLTTSTILHLNLVMTTVIITWFSFNNNYMI
jgi:hypothetical protein